MFGRTVFIRSGFLANYANTGQIEYPGLGGRSTSATSIGSQVTAGLGYGENLIFLTDYMLYHGFSLRCLAIE